MDIMKIFADTAYVRMGGSAEELRAAEYLKEQGIGTIIHYPIPPHLSQAYAYLGFRRGDFPIAEKVAVAKADPVEGLKNAVCEKAEKGAFGELIALYVRKSSAELNLCK